MIEAYIDRDFDETREILGRIDRGAVAAVLCPFSK